MCVAHFFQLALLHSDYLYGEGPLNAPLIRLANTLAPDQKIYIMRVSYGRIQTF